MTGRTEKAILLDTLALNGVADADSRFDEFYSALAVAANGLRDRMRERGRRLAGSKEALAELARHNVLQTVATGNIKPIAITKLEVFGLDEHIDFEIGGYGSDGSTRATLVRQAWQRAERKYEYRFAASRVVVIGDTPHDIQAARKVGVRSTGVATGSSTVDELSAAQPDTLLPNLSDTQRVMWAVFDQAPRQARTIESTTTLSDSRHSRAASS